MPRYSILPSRSACVANSGVGSDASRLLLTYSSSSLVGLSSACSTQPKARPDRVATQSQRSARSRTAHSIPETRDINALPFPAGQNAMSWDPSRLAFFYWRQIGFANPGACPPSREKGGETARHWPTPPRPLQSGCASPICLIRLPANRHAGRPMPHTDPNITAQIETFTQQIVATVEAAVAQRIQAALAGAFGAPQKRGPGRPPKHLAATAHSTFASVS